MHQGFLHRLLRYKLTDDSIRLQQNNQNKSDQQKISWYVPYQLLLCISNQVRP